MNTVDDGGPAFPVPCAQPFGDDYLETSGMTYRQWLVGNLAAATRIGCLVIQASGKKVESEMDITEMIHSEADAIIAHQRKEEEGGSDD